MLSAKEAADMLGVSPSRVRKLIADHELPAHKVGNAWALEEKDVINRLSSRPKAGRPHRNDAASTLSPREESQRSSDRVRRAKQLFEGCRDILSVLPDASMIDDAESSEEAAFYIAVSDFFLQQRQHELIRQGVF